MLCLFIYLFCRSIILHWHDVETNSSLSVLFISAVCLCSAANKWPFANSVWVYSALFSRTVSVYCPFVAGSLGRWVCICTHAWAIWVLSAVGVYERIMIGAGGGGACYLQQLIRKEKKGCSSLSGPRQAGGMKQPNSLLTLNCDIFIYVTSRDRQGYTKFHSFIFL